MAVKLSILIPTLPSRFDCFNKLVEELEEQIGNKQEVEILGLLDNKASTLGTKRTQMMQMCQGEYFVFIDDDDSVIYDFVGKVLFALKSNPNLDLLTYNVELCYMDTGRKVQCTYTLGLKKGTTKGEEYNGPPAHTHVWRTELVRDIEFPSKNFKEDTEWCNLAQKRVKTHINLDRVLYFYNFSENNTETRG